MECGVAQAIAKWKQHVVSCISVPVQALKLQIARKKTHDRPGLEIMSMDSIF
jgi:hypothetical protein